MRPSDLLLDFGHPVAYYPGLVKYMGSPHAVIFFGQIFYWQDKAHAAEGVHKTREEIQHETGLTFEQQAVARKHLVSRGILVETNKRLEHKMFYRIDCERLNEIINENNQFSRNGENRFRETVKSNFAEEGKPSPRTRETPRRGEGKTNFDLTENTTEITSENTTESKNTIGASADASAPARSARQEYSPEFEQAWQEYPKRAGGNSKSAAFKAWKARLREGIKPEVMLDGVKRYAAWVRATGNTGTQFVKQAATFFARIAAALGFYIKRGDAASFPTDNDWTPTEQKPRYFDISPGMIFDELAPGEDLGMVESNRPNVHLYEFRNGQLRAVAAGTRGSYSSIARDYNGSYSSQRQELVEGYEGYGVLQQWFVGQYSRPVYRAWLEQAIPFLDIPPDVDMSTLFNATYLGPVMPWIDPVKEAAAWRAILRGGAGTEAEWISGWMVLQPAWPP